jgi:hypothetical protein
VVPVLSVLVCSSTLIRDALTFDLKRDVVHRRIDVLGGAVEHEPAELRNIAMAFFMRRVNSTPGDVLRCCTVSSVLVGLDAPVFFGCNIGQAVVAREHSLFKLSLRPHLLERPSLGVDVERLTDHHVTFFELLKSPLDGAFAFTDFFRNRLPFCV